jgi:cytochrome c553
MRTRRSTTTLLALLLAPLVSTGCGPGEAAAEAAGGSSASASVEQGRALYRAQLCTNCHGEAGAGGDFAPALRNLSAHWTRAELVLYLRDPRAFPNKSQRLVELEADYPRLMPPYSNLTDAERGALADWMLAAE